MHLFTHISIDESLTSTSRKYYGLLSNFGLEWGVGIGGSYPGHFHLGFTDVIFAPSGMVVADEFGVSHRGTLLVVPPGVWFSPDRVEAFWFMKLFGSVNCATVDVPDKIGDRSRWTATGDSLRCVDTGDFVVPWWDPRSQTQGALRLQLGSESLAVLRNDRPWLMVSR